MGSVPRRDAVSGIGVLDKAVSVLDAVEAGPLTLAALVEATGLSRATAHRLAVALETHRLLARDGAGRFVLGPRLTGLDLPARARPAHVELGALPLSLIHI